MQIRLAKKAELERNFDTLATSNSLGEKGREHQQEAEKEDNRIRTLKEQLNFQFSSCFYTFFNQFKISQIQFNKI